MQRQNGDEGGHMVVDEGDGKITRWKREREWVLLVSLVQNLYSSMSDYTCIIMYPCGNSFVAKAQ